MSENGNNHLTLQLTVPALLKLFEGDPDVVLHIRKAAVAEFTRRKIGTLLDAASKALVESEVAKQVGTIKGYPAKITLAEPILNALKESCATAMKEHEKAMWSLVHKQIATQIDAHLDSIREKVSAEVKRRIDSEVTARINTGVRTRMDAAIKAAKA